MVLSVRTTVLVIRFGAWWKCLSASSKDVLVSLLSPLISHASRLTPHSSHQSISSMWMSTIRESRGKWIPSIQSNGTWESVLSFKKRTYFMPNFSFKSVRSMFWPKQKQIHLSQFLPPGFFTMCLSFQWKSLKHKWRTLNPFPTTWLIVLNQWSEHSTWETYLIFNLVYLWFLTLSILSLSKRI